MSDVPYRLGQALRSSRLASGWSQATVAERSGLSTSSYSRMELGAGGPVTLDRWIAATTALDRSLVIDLLATPSDDTAVRLLRLVEGLAERGGWSTHTTDSLDAPLHVRIARPARREAAVVSIWDAVTDVGRAVDDFHHAVAGEATRRPPDWRTGGLVVVRPSRTNRRRLSQTRALLDCTFPDTGSRWIHALSDVRSRMPETAAMAWASFDLSRLTPARLPLIRPRRAAEDVACRMPA